MRSDSSQTRCVPDTRKKPKKPQPKRESSYFSPWFYSSSPVFSSYRSGPQFSAFRKYFPSLRNSYAMAEKNSARNESYPRKAGGQMHPSRRDGIDADRRSAWGARAAARRRAANCALTEHTYLGDAVPDRYCVSRQRLEGHRNAR